MRHRKSGVKLNRSSSHRKAMFRNMVTSLFKHSKIRTTNAKAKELRKLADKMITLAKRGDLHARRQALSVMREKAVVHILFNEAADKYSVREGGYTRITKLGPRKGDVASMVMIELIQEEAKKTEPKKKATKKKDPKKTEVKKKDPKKTEVKKEEPKKTEVKKEEPKKTEVEAEA